MRTLLTIFLLCVSPVLFAQKKSKKAADPLAGIETELQQVLKDRRAAGFAVAVVRKDQVIYLKGFGYRDYENKIPVTPETLFAIGSCTKAFTSSLIGLLNKDGLVEYDKPVRNYLPDLHFANNELSDGVTLRDMMCHRTGLPRHDYSWYLFKSKSRDSLIQRIQYLEPTAALRQTWQYNNFMFLAQGVVVEKLTHKSWENNIREQFFSPLGMKRSNFSIQAMEADSNAAKGYRVYKDSIIRKMDYYHIDAMGPAGSINSSVKEMSNWLMTWISGGKFHEKEIIPEAYATMAISSQMVAGAGLPDKDIPDAQFGNYGFGWFLSSYRGHYRVEHGGNIDGFSASTSFFPSDSIGIVVLSNQNGSAVPGIVRNLIADRLLDLNRIDWNARANEAEAKARKNAATVAENATSSQVKGTHPSHDLEAYTGLFDNPGYGYFEVALKGDSLMMLLPADEKVWLRHYHFDIFETFGIDKKTGIDTSEKSQLKIQFHMNTAGEIAKITMPLQPGLEDIVFTRKPKPQEITRAELEKYLGEYQFSAAEVVKFYIKGENTMYAFIKGQPEYELVPTGKNTFALKELKGFKAVFEENEKGEITAVNLIQPNGTFKAKKKTE